MTDGSSPAEVYRLIRERLREGGVEDFETEAIIISEELYGRDFRTKLITGGFGESRDVRIKEALEIVRRRLSSEPLQYIIGSWEFYGMEFSVGRGVLIPRQDTETLIDCCIELLGESKGIEAIDLCSGTGCIPIVLEKRLNLKKIYAAELYDEAYSYLQKNIRESLSGVVPVKLDVMDEGSPRLFSGLQLITCNPPYLDGEDIRGLQAELRHEPRSALYGGEDGLDYYRGICRLWTASLAPGGWLVFEIGCSQAEAVAGIMSRAGLSEIGVKKDLSGKDRVVYGKR